MTLHAQKFLTTLKPEQQKTAVMDYAAKERIDWHFIPKKERKGLQIRDMDENQRKAAHSLLKSCLSQVGYDKATKIMDLENLLLALETKNKPSGNLRDPERYYFTVFGQPTADARWGLSIEGHHLTLNFVVEKGKVISSTPTVFCTNPALVKTDLVPKYKGWQLLAKEESLAFDLLASLDDEQRKVAVVANEALKEVRNAGVPQPPTDAAVGISADKLTADQQKILTSLLEVYCRNLPEEIANERLTEIKGAGLAAVKFAWMGSQKPGIGHYYRIQGPTFLVEFVNTQPDADGNPANHIHCMWRDMRGDFALPIQ